MAEGRLRFNTDFLSLGGTWLRIGPVTGGGGGGLSDPIYKTSMGTDFSVLIEGDAVVFIAYRQDATPVVTAVQDAVVSPIGSELVVQNNASHTRHGQAYLVYATGAAPIVQFGAGSADAGGYVLIHGTDGAGAVTSAADADSIDYSASGYSDSISASISLTPSSGNVVIGIQAGITIYGSNLDSYGNCAKVIQSGGTEKTNTFWVTGPTATGTVDLSESFTQSTPFALGVSTIIVAVEVAPA